MNYKLEDLLTDDERLDLWLELSVLANTIDEVTDWWWRVDPGIRRANLQRAGQSDKQEISD